MNRTEAKEYFKNLAVKENLTEAEYDSILKAFDNEKTAKLVLDAFVPRPEYSTALDQKEKERLAALTSEKEVRDWYNTKGKPAYDQNQASIDLLNKYRETYGNLDAGERKELAKEAGMTKAEVEKFMDEKLTQSQNAMNTLLKQIPRLATQHFKEFGEVLDMDELEKLAVGKNLPVDIAYKEMIAPKVEERRQADFTKKLADAKLEGAREARSKMIPGDTASRTPNLLTDREKLPEGADPDKISRDAFSQGWNDWAEKNAS
jgi:hypothetical protein